MKRSDAIRLTVMGVAFAAAAAVSRDPKVVGGAFSDIPSCRNEGLSNATCVGAYQSALTRHYAKAPRYPDLAACQTATDGACAADQSKPGQFMPVMSGFSVTRRACEDEDNGCPSSSSSGGHSGGGSSGWYGSGGKSASSQAEGEPIYESRSQRGSYRVGSPLGEGGHGLGPANVRTGAISRGGFGFHGGSGHGFGGHGGS